MRDIHWKSWVLGLGTFIDSVYLSYRITDPNIPMHSEQPLDHISMQCWSSVLVVAPSESK